MFWENFAVASPGKIYSAFGALEFPVFKGLYWLFIGFLLDRYLLFAIGEPELKPADVKEPFWVEGAQLRARYCVGTYDKTKYSTNANYEQYTGLGKGTSKSETTEEKRIVKPETFATLKDIILLSPFGFFRVNKTPYYSHKAFKI